MVPGLSSPFSTRLTMSVSGALAGKLCAACGRGWGMFDVDAVIGTREFIPDYTAQSR